MDYTTLSNLMAEISIGKTGYSFILNNSGNIIAHPNFQYVLDGKNFIEDAEEDDSLYALAELSKKMIKGETGNGEYKLKVRTNLWPLRQYPKQTGL